ncbi:MAG: DUF5689 domain-containing protein [Flavobacteriaceae bacterium]
MKKNSLFLILLLCWMCIPEKPEAPPALELGAVEAPPINTSITAVQNQIRQGEGLSLKFETDTPLWLAGYVSSSDLAGNFYKELYLQSSPSDPQSALRVLLDQPALALTYPRGQEVFIQLNGLGAGYQNGMFTLGAYRVDGIGPIPFYAVKKHVVRGTSSATLTPLALSPEAFSPAHLGKWIAVANSQFVSSEAGKTFAGQAYDRYEGERPLRACAGQKGFWLSTSVYADFKSVVLPQGSGTVAGILTRDYYDEKYILKVNTPEDIAMTESRCDPFFEAYFETHPLGQFADTDWYNFPQQGTRYWQVYQDEYSNGQSLKISAYGSGDIQSDSWLISPELDVRTLNNPVLHFRTSTLYADKSTLSAYLLFDWSPETALLESQPQRLPVRIANKGDDPDRWIDSGGVDLGDIVQPFRIAFRYQGNGKSTYDGTFELDDLYIAEAVYDQK